MAKLKTDAVQQSDLVDYLDDCSDFAFEVGVLKELVNLGFSCEHAGSYTDPWTKKIRQFDIRATKEIGIGFLRLAVECKNVRENFPLLASCLPRREEEAFHSIVVSVDPEKVQLEKPRRIHSRAELVESKVLRPAGSLYKAGEPVGKSCDQVGRTLNDDITSTDSEVYEKWSQALSSASDLVDFCHRDGMDRSQGVGKAVAAVFPLVVVPDGRLWVAQYDEKGTRTSLPTQVDRCSYFVNVNYAYHRPFGVVNLRIPHLEFVTVRGLETFIRELCGSEKQLEAVFPSALMHAVTKPKTA